MAKVPTLAEKHDRRQRYVKAAFIFMIMIPISALGLLVYGIDPSPASAIFSTASASFASILIANLASTPTNHDKE